MRCLFLGWAPVSPRKSASLVPRASPSLELALKHHLLKKMHLPLLEKLVENVNVN